MPSFETLFTTDRIYISNKTTQKEVFAEVYQDLLRQDCVTEDFF